MSEFGKVALFTGKDVSCTGEQLIQLLNSISSSASGVWYGGDLEWMQYQPTSEFLLEKKLEKIGNTEQLISLINPENQMLSGVFLLFKDDLKEKKDIFVDTEDDIYRKYYNEIAQIRLFDTTYIEFYFDSDNFKRNIENYNFDKFALIKILSDKNISFWDVMKDSFDQL